MKNASFCFLLQKNWRKMKVNHGLIWLQVLQDFQNLLVLSQIKIRLVNLPVLKTRMKATDVLVFIFNHFLKVESFWWSCLVIRMFLLPKHYISQALNFTTKREVSLSGLVVDL
jgi:hypothetical protein